MSFKVHVTMPKMISNVYNFFLQFNLDTIGALTTKFRNINNLFEQF